MAAAKPAFRRVMSDLSKGTVLKPLLHSYLFDAKFPGIDLHLEKIDSHSLGHGPDGWFHPSTHPLWTERQLYYYLHDPDSIEAEEKEYMGTLSVTFGKLTHTFIQICLSDLGVLEQPTMKQILANDEPAIFDLETKSRGHYDGEVRVLVPSVPDVPLHLFEFKTKTPMAKLPEDLDLEWLIRKHPEYYLQVQDYMRMTGLSHTILLMMAMGYPWELREFHIPADEMVQYDLRTKYRNVLVAVDEHELPEACCSPRSKESRLCPARAICPIAAI